MRIAALYRYPVKGLSPEPLERVTLNPGEFFPGDRLYAIENGPSGFNPAAPVHQPKVKFLMLARNARLAALTTRYDAVTTRLSVEQDRVEMAAGELATAVGCAVIEGFFERFCTGEMRGPARVLAAPNGFRFTDSRSGFVSLINLASVHAVSDKARSALHPLRFRANIYVDGLQPWEEFALVGRKLRAGALELEITKPIDRCAAIDVMPGRGRRDTDLIATMERALAHHDCGVYARVTVGGELVVGDELAPAYSPAGTSSASGASFGDPSARGPPRRRRRERRWKPPPSPAKSRGVSP
jgi:uncharacterized protein YcbX